MENTTEKMQVINIDPKEFGIEEKKASQISAQFKPMLDKMEELEGDFNDVMSMKHSPEKVAQAKELRLKYVKVRTGTAAIHKEQKAFYLSAGRFVDGWKNAQLFAGEGNESQLMDIEKHDAIIEQELQDKLSEKRRAELVTLEQEFIPDNLGAMEAPVWDNYLAGAKSNHNAKKEAEKQAAELLIEVKRKEKLHNERKEILIPLWNFIKGHDQALNFGSIEDGTFEIILSEAEKAKTLDEALREEQRILNERLKKEAEKKEKQDKLDAKKREEKAEKDRKEHASTIEKERNERVRVEATLKALEDAFQKESEESKQAELAKSDGAKMKDLISDLQLIRTKYSFKSKKHQKIHEDVGVLIDKIVDHINK